MLTALSQLLIGKKTLSGLNSDAMSQLKAGTHPAFAHSGLCTTHLLVSSSLCHTTYLKRLEYNFLHFTEEDTQVQNLDLYLIL